MKSLLNQMDEVTRRRVVARAAQAFLGVNLIPMLPGLRSAFGADAPVPATAVKGTAKQVIYIYLTGGMSHLDTFDPKPGTQAQGPTGVIDTNVTGIQVSQHLPSVAKQMDKISLVRSLSSKQGAHDRGQYFMRTSYAPIATTRHPALGAWVVKLTGKSNPSLPANVLVGGAGQHPGAGFLESKYSPLPIGNPEQGLKNSSPPRDVDEKTFDRRMKLSESFDQSFRQRYTHKEVKAYTDFYHDAMKLMKSDDLQAFDLSKEKPETRSAYGQDRFGQGVLLARRLVEHGVRFVEVNFGNWDTHQDNFDRIEELAGTLDQALAALLADLASRGTLNETLVVVATEFGRTPEINGSDGRDHHPRVFTCLMAGGGVKGGYVHGSSDKNGYAVESDGVTIPDFNATIAAALGLSLEEKITSPDGRPFTFADKGKPIAAIFA